MKDFKEIVRGLMDLFINNMFIGVCTDVVLTTCFVTLLYAIKSCFANMWYWDLILLIPVAPIMFLSMTLGIATVMQCYYKKYYSKD